MGRTLVGFRLRHNEWHRQVWKFITTPLAGIVALVAVVLMALGTLVTEESRGIRGANTPVIFSPK
jgi:hypothetical protein